MLGSLARLALIIASFVFVVPNTLAHDSWISRGGHRNAAGFSVSLERWLADFV